MSLNIIFALSFILFFLIILVLLFSLRSKNGRQEKEFLGDFALIPIEEDFKKRLKELVFQEMKKELNENIKKVGVNLISENERILKSFESKIQGEALELKNRTGQFYNSLSEKNSEIVNELKKRAAEILSSLSSKMEKEIISEIEKTKREIEDHKKKRMQEVENDIYQIVQKIAKDLIGKSIDLSTHKELVENALQRARKELLQK